MCFSSVLVLRSFFFFFFFNDTATTEIYTLSLHDALPISLGEKLRYDARPKHGAASHGLLAPRANRSEEHTSELQSRLHLVCRLLLEKKKKIRKQLTLPLVPQADDDMFKGTNPAGQRSASA